MQTCISLVTMAAAEYTYYQERGLSILIAGFEHQLYHLLTG